jgi:osmotically inducible protein OsmC
MRRASPCRSLDFVPQRVDSYTDVVIETDGTAFPSVHLTVTARIPSIDRDTFQSIAAKAKAGCPVFKLIKVMIDFEATLSP